MSSTLCTKCQENKQKHQTWYKDDKYVDFRLYHLTTFVWLSGHLQVTEVPSMHCNFQNLQRYVVTESKHSLDFCEGTLKMHKFDKTQLQNKVFLNIIFLLLKIQVFGH
jgi:hypothetical protein